jgi:hypothetical protein
MPLTCSLSQLPAAHHSDRRRSSQTVQPIAAQAGTTHAPMRLGSAQLRSGTTQGTARVCSGCNTGRASTNLAPRSIGQSWQPQSTRRPADQHRESEESNSVAAAHRCVTALPRYAPRLAWRVQPKEKARAGASVRRRVSAPRADAVGRRKGKTRPKHCITRTYVALPSFVRVSTAGTVPASTAASASLRAHLLRWGRV